MKKIYFQPELTVETVELSSHLLDGSVLGIGGGTGKPQGGARVSGRTPIE